MPARRRRHFAVDRLSEEGQAVVREGQAANWTLGHIVGELQRRTGEEISETAVHRWLADQRLQVALAERQAALDTAVQLVNAMPDPRFLGALNNAMKDMLLGRTEELESQSTPELLVQMLRLEKAQLEHKRVAIDEQFAKAATIKAIASEKSAEAALTQADAAMKRVEHLLAQATTVRQKLEGAAAAATDGKVPAEVLSEAVRALYGIEIAQGAGDAP